MASCPRGQLADAEAPHQRQQDQAIRPHRHESPIFVKKLGIRGFHRRIAEVNRRADREAADVHEAIADLQHICADPDQACRYFVVAEKPEIEENEFNLNLPRYVDTFEPEEEIKLDTALTEFQAAKNASDLARGSLAKLLGIEM